MTDALSIQHGGMIHVQFSENCDRNLTVAGREKVLSFCFGQILENSHGHGAKRVQVDVRRSSRTQPGSLAEREVVEIMITDDGPGVPEDCIEEVFAWKKERLRVKGRGEAMPLCRLYIRQMDGEMWCENATPTGLRTSVSLPLLDATID